MSACCRRALEDLVEVNLVELAGKVRALRGSCYGGPLATLLKARAHVQAMEVIAPSAHLADDHSFAPAPKGTVAPPKRLLLAENLVFAQQS